MTYKEMDLADLYWMLRHGTKSQRRSVRRELRRRGEDV